MSNENKHFSIEILDTDKFIKANDVKEVTNPIFFIRNGVPTPDGLLSNDIFGISMEERANIFGYIRLNGTFLHPLIYKIWSRMDNNIRDIAHGTKRYTINSKGEFVQNDDGETGIDFLKKNIDKIKIRKTDSDERNLFINFIMSHKDLLFIDKMIVIPAYYRDTNNTGSAVGVGKVNKMYRNLIVACRAIKETADFGLELSHSACGRVQEAILTIYDWLTKEPNLSKKKGIMRRAVLGKTADYSARLVISAPELKVEYVDDLKVTADYAALPLASLCTNLFPFIIYWIRRWFENNFAGETQILVYDKKGNPKYIKIKDPLTQFSDDRIKHEIDRFMKGFSNRFIPVTAITEEGTTISLRFMGRNKPTDEENKNAEIQSGIINRRLTWCDLIYMAAVEMSKDKNVLITRYPMDSFYGQTPMGIVVNSTKETEPMYLNNNQFYPHYPKIREEDIGSNTANKFIDTLQMSNIFLKEFVGDYKPRHCSLPFLMDKTKIA